MPVPDPLLDVSHGERGVAEHLRQSLQTLINRSDDPDFVRTARRVLDGRLSLRDAYDSTEFTRALNPLVEASAQRIREMDSLTRERLEQEGVRQLRDMGRPSRQTQPPIDDEDDGYPYGGPILTSDW